VCCGNYEGLDAALAVPQEGMTMAKVFAARPGDVLRLGGYGEATDKVPAMVPDAVAKKDYANKDVYRVEMDEPEKGKARKGREA